MMAGCSPRPLSTWRSTVLWHIFSFPPTYLTEMSDSQNTDQEHAWFRLCQIHFDPLFIKATAARPPSHAWFFSPSSWSKPCSKGKWLKIYKRNIADKCQIMRTHCFYPFIWNESHVKQRHRVSAVRVIIILFTNWQTVQKTTRVIVFFFPLA